MQVWVKKTIMLYIIFTLFSWIYYSYTFQNIMHLFKYKSSKRLFTRQHLFQNIKMVFFVVVVVNKIHYFTMK